MNPLLLLFILALGYFIWSKIIKMYYIYWYYSRQGIPATKFPMPIFGNSLDSQKRIGALTEFDLHPIPHLLRTTFGMKVPKVFINFRGPIPILVFTDPELLHELYITKNKYFDKEKRIMPMFKEMIGESILFSQSNELWRNKR